MPFAKLSSRITKSSLWSEECYVRVVFLSFLAEKDENGFVESDYYAMQRTCNVTIEEFDKAVKILESKDDRSRTPDNDGKRIKRVQGGWIVLNHEMYKLPEDVKREQTRLRVQRYRSVTEALQSVTDELPSVSVSDSVSEEDKSDERRNKKNIIPPKLEWVEAYCKERNNGINAKTFIDHYTATNWMRGKNKIKDWQACIRTWEQNNKQSSEQQPKKQPFWTKPKDAQ